MTFPRINLFFPVTKTVKRFLGNSLKIWRKNLYKLMFGKFEKSGEKESQRSICHSHCKRDKMYNFICTAFNLLPLSLIKQGNTINLVNHSIKRERILFSMAFIDWEETVDSNWWKFIQWRQKMDEVAIPQTLMICSKEKSLYTTCIHKLCRNMYGPLAKEWDKIMTWVGELLHMKLYL